MTDVRGEHKAALTHKCLAQCSTAPNTAQLPVPRSKAPGEQQTLTASHTLSNSPALTEKPGNAQVRQFASCRINRMAVFIQVISGGSYQKSSRDGKREMVMRCQKVLG